MPLDRELGDVQLGTDLLVAQSSGQAAHDLEFPIGQRVQQFI
jgi:hypothetical protein